MFAVEGGADALHGLDHLIHIAHVEGGIGPQRKTDTVGDDGTVVVQTRQARPLIPAAADIMIHGDFQGAEPGPIPELTEISEGS